MFIDGLTKKEQVKLEEELVKYLKATKHFNLLNMTNFEMKLQNENGEKYYLFSWKENYNNFSNLTKTVFCQVELHDYYIICSNTISEKVKKNINKIYFRYMDDTFVDFADKFFVYRLSVINQQAKDENRKVTVKELKTLEKQMRTYFSINSKNEDENINN